MGIAYSASLMVRALKGLGRSIYHPAIKQRARQTTADVIKRARKGSAMRTITGDPMLTIQNYIKARGPWSKRGIEVTSGIPMHTGRLLKKKKSLTGQLINTRYKAPTADFAQARTFKSGHKVGHGKPLGPNYVTSKKMHKALSGYNPR